MISSESINFSKYSKITEDNKETSQNKILLETKENSEQKQESGDLSQALTLSNPDPNNNSEESKNNISNLLYGNSYEVLKPKLLGKSYAFFYDHKGNPRITIGPDCKYL